MATVKKTYKFPKQIGLCADLLYTLKAKRLVENKTVLEIKAEETALKTYIIDTLPKSEATGATGKLARVTIVQKSRPEVKDFEAFVKYCIKNKRLDLLTKSCSPEGIYELWEAGKVVPGIEEFKYKSISLNKV